jgi:hypothetical protein
MPARARRACLASRIAAMEKHLLEAVGTDLTITLSSHFTRYVTLPPQTEITTREVMSYATFRMRGVCEH